MTNPVIARLCKSQNNPKCSF